MAEKLLKNEFPLTIWDSDVIWKIIIAVCVGAFITYCALTPDHPKYEYKYKTSYPQTPTPTPTPLSEDGNSTNRPDGELTEHQKSVLVAEYHAIGFYKINGEIYYKPPYYACIDKKGNSYSLYDPFELYFHNETQIEALNNGYRPDKRKYCK